MIILNKHQADLLRSFLVGHGKEIENTEHADTMCEILRVLSSQARPDEGQVCDVILQNIDLLRCFNCDAQLADFKFLFKDDFIGELCIDPGESNYPHEPDVPAGVYFICAECSHRDMTRITSTVKRQAEVL
ncbi:MAG: hypothetical protein Q8J68_08065 [Methanolobus sp.]|uniref:hypothetical protein n=1 Tax=Methanolobus sp. TaxID=1874737 RepID=UPI002730B8CF|nr:hypothetical protein [Methanolobus sp.]MDP2217224.1 hypothetical protein [Methanolobus sp.]